MAALSSHHVDTNKSPTGADQLTESPNMSQNGHSFHLFGQLPPEIRLQIWETAVFDPPSRVCSFDVTVQRDFITGTLDCGDPSTLVVFDYPSLRYVCQESRRVALKHSAIAGWTIPGATHPYRCYDTHRDSLYIADGLGRSFELDRLFKSKIHGEIDVLNASAATRVRHTRHIVIPWWLLRLANLWSRRDIQNDKDFTYSFVADLMRIFQQLEEITVAISQLDVADSAALRRLTVSEWELPERPCKLSSSARFEPTSEEQPEITVVDNAYREEPLRSLFCDVGRISGSFERAANIIAATIGTRRVPAPKIAQVCQLVQGTEWEILPDTR